LKPLLTGRWKKNYAHPREQFHSVELRHQIKRGAARLKELPGDPHYVAKGMAIGVFVSITPTIPFHTVIALALAFIFRASKIAAAIGVWFSNPLTIPIFYFASYRAGSLLFGDLEACNGVCESVTDLLKLGIEVALATIIGGIVIGLGPAAAAYFITRTIVARMKSRQISL
jgi:uncharacterized protein (DUF2062 family)